MGMEWEELVICYQFVAMWLDGAFRMTVVPVWSGVSVRCAERFSPFVQPTQLGLGLSLFGIALRGSTQVQQMITLKVVSAAKKRA